MYDKSFEDLGFKVGDKVKCIGMRDKNCNLFTLGAVHILSDFKGIPAIHDTWIGFGYMWELVEDKVFKTKTVGIQYSVDGVTWVADKEMAAFHHLFKNYINSTKTSSQIIEKVIQDRKHITKLLQELDE